MRNSISLRARITMAFVAFVVVSILTTGELFAQDDDGKKKARKPSKRELRALMKAAEARAEADTMGRQQADTILVDSITGDSIKLLGGARPDTLIAKAGELPAIKRYEIERLGRRDSTGKVIKEEPRRPFSELAMQRSKAFKDTLTFSRLTTLSFVIPGFGQFYNNQKWKIPVLYGVTAGFTALTINASSKVKTADANFQAAVASGAAQLELDELRYTTNKYKTERTLYLAGAVASYLYFVGDAAINYKGEVNPTRKATILSTIFPGAGQIYNGSYWKLPIVYGGFATFAYVISFNNRGYQRFKTAYNALTDDNPDTVDEFNGAYSADRLQNTRDSFRRYRDMGIVYLAGFYLLNIIDAHVDAYLRRYDISDDLSMRIEPTVDQSIYLPAEGRSASVVGLGMKINF